MKAIFSQEFLMVVLLFLAFGALWFGLMMIHAENRVVNLHMEQADLLDTLHECRDSLNNWVDIADKEDLRATDSDAIERADALLARYGRK